MEEKWGVSKEIKNEWSGTFEKLLKYHNTQDLRTLSMSIFWNKPTGNEDLHKNDALDAKELENWMVPRLEPSLWKYYLWPEGYKKEELHYEAVKKALFSTEMDDIEINRLNSDIPSTQRGISKDNFLKGIVKELRDGNKEVNQV